MVHQLQLDVLGAHQPHVDDQGLAGSGELLPIGLLALLLAVARDKDGALGMVAVGERNARIGGGTGGSCDAGHHGEGDALLCQHFQLLAATAEHEGIPPLEPHHPVARPGVFNQQAVGLFLGHAVGAGLLADRHQGGIAAHQVQDLGGDQLVVEHHLGLLDLLQRLEGQQARIAGSRPYQHHLAHFAFRIVEPLVQPLLGPLPIGFLNQTGQGVGGKRPLPEAAAVGNGGEHPLGPVAYPTGELGQAAEVARQQALEPLAQQAHQHRRLAAAGDRHHDGAAIDDGGEDKAGALGVVHHVDEQTELVGALIDQSVHLEVVGGGYHQDLAGQVGRGEALRQMGEATGKFMEVGFQLGGDQGQPGTGRQQQARLAQGHFAPTHQQHRATVQFGKHRQIIHFGPSLGTRLIWGDYRQGCLSLKIIKNAF